MKLLIILLLSSAYILCLQGCNYGTETLKVVHPETITLIEQPSGNASKKILESNYKKGWFFIPQVILRPHEDKAWLAVRVYSLNPEFDYEISRAEVSFSQGSLTDFSDLEHSTSNWHSAEDGWSYQVVRVKSYSYSSFIASNINTARVEFELSVNGNVQSDEFDLEVKRVRRSGW